MYLASTEYLNYIDNSITRTPCSKVVIDGVEYSGRTHLKIYPKISHANTKMIGGFSAATCEFEIYNIDGTVNLNGKEVEIYRGLEINGAASWIPMGIFSATDDNITNNKTARSITFKGYDRAALFDVAFAQAEDITFPCTLLGFVEKLCARRGVRIESNNFPMASLVIETAPNIPADYTERQLISCAAELGGCIARINRAGNLEISKPFLTGRRISRTRYSAVSQEPAFGPINSVVFGHEGYNDDIVYPATAHDNLCEWRIEDNPFVENRREELIASVAKEIIGMSFIPFRITDCVEDYIFDINDSIEIESKDGTVFAATVLSKTTSSRIRSELKAETQKATLTNRKLAGSIKAAVKRVQLDVDHQNNRINALVEDSVSRAELEILSDEINMRFDDVEQPDTVENVTNAVTTINKYGVSIKNGSFTLKDNDNKILIGVNTDENGDMYVSGNIRANSLEADSVGAENIKSGAITTDKLSVGEATASNLFCNDDFSESTKGVVAWDGYNVALSKNTSGALALPVREGTNLLDTETSEFFSYSAWSVRNCTIRKPYDTVDYIELKPSSTTSFAEIYTPVKLEKGKTYSVAAQINPLSWSETDDSRKNECMGIVYGDKLGTYQTQQAFEPESGESNVEWVFRYNGESGNVNLGLYFVGMQDSNGNGVKVNIAWIAISETTREPGFYSSKGKWLAQNVNNTNLINGGSYLNSATKYLAYIQTSNGDDLRIIFQKKHTTTQQRYSLIAKMRFVNLSSVTSGGHLGVWGQNQDGGHSPPELNVNGTPTNTDIVVKFVFDQKSPSGIVDLGIAWQGFVNSTGGGCNVQFYWMHLSRDDTSEPGFYCSDANMLKSGYKETNLLPDTGNLEDYIRRPSMLASEDDLYFFGKVRSAQGNVGCLNYRDNQLFIESNAYYYTNSLNDLDWGEALYTSGLKVNIPKGVLDYVADNPTAEETVDLRSYMYMSLELWGADDISSYRSVLTPYALGMSDSNGNGTYMRADGIVSGGLRLSAEQIRYLAKNTPGA